MPVVPVCRHLPIAPQTYYAAKGRPPSKRALSDEVMIHQIHQIHQIHHGVYGVRRVHAELRRNGEYIARCTVERLMKREGLRGIRRAKGPRTTIPGPLADRPSDLVERRQYGAIRYTDRLADAEAVASVGSKGDSYDCQSVPAGFRKNQVVLAGTV